MDTSIQAIADFLESLPPYAHLPPEAVGQLAGATVIQNIPPDTTVYTIDQPQLGIYLVISGEIEIIDRNGSQVSLLTSRGSFGERGLLRDGLAATTARTKKASTLLHVPAKAFFQLLRKHGIVQRYFQRSRQAEARSADLAMQKVDGLVAREALACPPQTTAEEAARLMRDAHVSSLGVTHPDGQLVGLITLRDLANRVLAESRPPSTPVSDIMTRSPITLPPTALGSDVLHLMLEHRIGHLPITEHGRLTGMITQTDLTRFQAASATALVRDIAQAQSLNALQQVTNRIPQLLVQLVEAHPSHEVVTRLITDITDAVTRRLVVLAETALGPPPVPYLWLACGSQGRQEQSGLSDQDNCLFLDDKVTAGDMPYFEQLATLVCDGLNACGYVYCPGEMMATNPKWRQPIATWRRYFHTWATTHKPESQMLASVMFDLRPIAGQQSLYDSLQDDTLRAAAKNSIFMAHMIANSLKHTPPLGLIRGFSTVRSGRYRNHIDMKHNGVIPVTDLARVYALKGALTPVNTRARLSAAGDAGIISHSGMRDLIEAYDLIAFLRLENQARQIQAGEKPDNYLAPSELSDFERNHLRDAFVVVRTMQSALSQERGTLR